MITTNTTLNYSTFTIEEKDAIIDCMTIEIEILEMKLQKLAMEKSKLLDEINAESTGQAIYQRYGFAWMDKMVNDIKVTVPVLNRNQEVELNSPLRIVWGRGGVNKPVEI